MLLIRYCLTLLLCVMIAPVWGQVSGGNSLTIGFGLTGIGYLGDFSDSQSFLHRIYPGGNLSLQVETMRPLSLQVNVGFGKFAEQFDGHYSSLPNGITPNSFVETSFFYGDLRLKYTFLKGARFMPYVAVGAGLLVFSPRDENGKFLSDAFLTRTEGEQYNTAIPQLPGVVGVQGRLNKTLSFSLDYTYRLTPTDYLDNVGNLGGRKGNDALHGLQLTMYITLGQPKDISGGPYRE